MYSKKMKIESQIDICLEVPAHVDFFKLKDISLFRTNFTSSLIGQKNLKYWYFELKIPLRMIFEESLLPFQCNEPVDVYHIPVSATTSMLF